MITTVHYHLPHLIITDDGVVVGPTCNSNLYCDVFAATRTLTLQPFEISTTTTATATTLTALKSPGGIIMSGTLGFFPFTSAQWKELQRQAMIYKYMMASVPVPPDLLLPNIARNFSLDHSQSHLVNGSMFNLRFPSNNKDAEPGRCKRTDGKKWRCSRDVAPHQKYCERHMNRGRPRSRKHVEVHAPFTTTATTAGGGGKKTRHQLNPIPGTPMAVSELQVLGSTIQPNQNPHVLNKSSAANYKEPTRGLDWVMKGEVGTTLYATEQQWQQMIQTNIGLTTNGSIYKEETMIPNLVFGAPVNTDFVSLGNEIQRETPRGFIDAWSNESMDFKNESSVSSQGNLSPSSLTLSMAMAAGNVLDEEMCHIQMGSEKHPQDSSWLNHTVSWIGSGSGSGLGGPLAEALGPSPVAIGPSPASSPSGVLQRTMVSLSDSSGCNSPTTLAGSMAVPETSIGFQFLS